MVYNWESDALSGIRIIAARMDTQEQDIAANGLSNCLTRDGQGSAQANLPMNGFRHTGVSNATALDQYASAQQAQISSLAFAIAAGTADAITATYMPAVASLTDGMQLLFRAAGTNTTTVPTFSPNGFAAHPITKFGDIPLAAGDITTNQECIVRYNMANNVWELLNPPTSPLAIESVSSIAALQALGLSAVRFPYVNVLSYYAGTVGGGGVFYWDSLSTATADGGTIIAVTGVSVGRYIRQIKADEPYNALWYGCRGDGSTDNTAGDNPIQRWLDSRKSGRTLYMPAGTYMVTKSLDCTSPDFATAVANGVTLVGENELTTQILGELTEQFPVMDFAGSAYATVRNITIGTIQQSTTSQATCAALVCKAGTEGIGTGNSFTAENVRFQVSFTGNSFAQASLVIFCSDEPYLKRSLMLGQRATIGIGKPSSVTSKFQTIPVALDFTCGLVEGCDFIATDTAPLEFTGGGALTVVRSYFGIQGAGSGTGAAGAPANIIVSSPNSSSNNLWLLGIRTENNSSDHGKAVIYWKAASKASFITGELETDVSGIVFKSDSGFNLTGMYADVFTSRGLATFALAGGISNSTIRSFVSGGTFGTIGDLNVFSTFGLSLDLPNTPTNLTWAVLKNQPGITVAQQGGTALSYTSTYAALIAPPSASNPIKYSGAALDQAVSPAAYTGGSGEKLIFTLPVPVSIVQVWGGSGWPFTQSGTIRMTGRITSTAAASGSIRVNLLQGSNSLDLITITTLNAFVSGNDGLIIEVYPEYRAAGAANQEFVVRVTAGSQSFSHFVSLASTGIDFTADASIRFYETNTGNDPYQIFYARMDV